MVKVITFFSFFIFAWTFSSQAAEQQRPEIAALGHWIAYGERLAQEEESTRRIHPRNADRQGEMKLVKERLEVALDGLSLTQDITYVGR